VAGHALVAGVDVGAEVAEGMADVEPSPLGYGNMSITNSFRREGSKPSESGPVGLAAWYVPSSSQRSCQRASISLARAAP
jgi:hypothetical protein